jgi:hypothetical protein
MGERRDAYRVLVRKFEGRRPLERPTRRWEDNIKMDLKEVVWEEMDWTDLAEGRDEWWTLVNYSTVYPRTGHEGPEGGPQSGRVRKISPPPGLDPRTVQPVASPYTDYAIPAHADSCELGNEPSVSIKCGKFLE